ncbi:4-hydroxy-tetrahydrodipicolinate synthase, partial [Turicimonas muris]|uniref:4-hydroxy-tetrahydrodipicolinate synthase n=1 Tax=Turicimonas muris TaxID=1796652 RepID=UPI0025A53BFD
MITGSIVALVTPMFEDGTIDYDSYKNLIEMHIAAGTDAIVAVGTTGESPTVDFDEHNELIRVAVEAAAGRIPVIAGTGSNCTDTAIYLSTEAEKYGADGVLLVTPYYNKATQNGLAEHFIRIASAIQIPVILYNVPGRTGCNILPETVVRIAKEAENVVAVKEASGNISQVAKLAALIREEKLEFDIYSGNDDQIVPVLALGGKGVISVLSNVAPENTHNIVQTYLDGDVQTSLNLQLQALSLIDALF